MAEIDALRNDIGKLLSNRVQLLNDLRRAGGDALASSMSTRFTELQNGLRDVDPNDLTRLQALRNKYDEAMNVLTTYLKKMQQATQSIINNMR